MKPVLLQFPAPALIPALLILAGIALIVGVWWLWLRRRGAYTRDSLQSGIAVLIMCALFLLLLNRIGEVRVNAYGAMLMLGFIAGAATTVRLGIRRGIAADHLLNMGLFILVGAIVGARVVFVLITPGEPLLDMQQVIRQGLGGLSFHGGLLGGLVTGSLYILLNKLPYWRVTDCAAPGIAIGYAITRIGCFLNGCCLGKPAHDLPWHVVFPHTPEVALRGVAVHPTQLYAMLMGLVMYGILLLLSRGANLGRAGRLFMTLLVLEGIERFVMEIYRYPDPHFHGGLTSAQLASIIIAGLGIVGWFVLPKRPAVDAVSVPPPPARAGSDKTR